MRKNYVDNAKQFIGAPWTPIPDSIFQEYSINGNRMNYEERAYRLRQQFACIAMAEVMQDEGQFVADIIKGLHYFKNETWWGVPAHYSKPLPDPNLQTVEIFSAETANMLAWACYMLEDRIKQYDQNICPAIRQEISRRILIPARSNDYTWKRRSWNHNTWTCANWLSCILFCENNRQQQIDDICQVLRCLDIFIDGYPEDGACDEGPHYWDRAAASLFECMQLLSLASNGEISLPLTEKIKSMANYVCTMYIGNGYYVNFADTYSNMLPNINVLYPFGLAIGNKEMTRHAAFIARQHNFSRQPAVLFDKSTLYPSISRELCFLRLLSQFKDETPEEAQTKDCWLKNTEILTAHNLVDGHSLFLAAKGGHNDESHNHNDVGNFIVYVDATPAIIDIGVGTYTAQTFSAGRYQLPNTRSAYHNVPIINGFEQHEGRQYRATNVRQKLNGTQATLSMNLEQAYPPEAAVDRWKRTILLDRQKQAVVLTDEYTLATYRNPSCLVFICCGKPALQEQQGTALINTGKRTCRIAFDRQHLKATVEPIDTSDPVIKNTWKGKQLYRLQLSVTDKKLKGKLTTTITAL